VQLFVRNASKLFTTTLASLLPPSVATFNHQVSMPQPLPSQLPESLHHSDVTSEIRSAYSKILLLEQAAVHSNHDVRLVHARILGYLIREGPSIQASEHVAKEINMCQHNDQMDKIGEMYHLHFLRVFKRQKGATPAPSVHPSPPSFQTKKEMMKDMLRQGGEAPQRHDQAKKNALVRDDFRCIVSGKYDGATVEKNNELMQEMERDHWPVCNTQCAHIFPQSTNVGISGHKEGGPKHEYAATVWTIMECFGYEDLPKKLNGTGIHSLDNIMTLEINIHSWFDELLLWFEAVDGEENTYKICATEQMYIYELGEDPIMFRTAHQDLQLPNPTYLQIHAACCRVAHLSGAGKYMDKILEDLEDMPVLSNDGSSADVLSYALQPYGQEVVV